MHRRQRTWLPRAGRLRLTTLALLAAAAAPGASAAPGADGPAYEIPWFTLDGGGTTSTGGTLELRGTLGQPDAGTLSGGAFVLQGGFWTAGGAVGCTGDTNGDAIVDVDDLIVVILAWGSADADADTNDDGIVNVDDLVTVLLAWGPC